MTTCQQDSVINFQNFNELPESNIYYRKFERVFSGRMTKRRLEIIDSFCRRHTYDIPVYSDRDCTGKLCGKAMRFEYKHNQVVIRLTMSYDY